MFTSSDRAIISSERNSMRSFSVLPEAIILDEILPRLDLDSLCSLCCVCRTFYSLASQAMSTLPSLDLSDFSPNGEILDRIIPRSRGVKSVTIDCLRFDDKSGANVLGPHIEELSLLKWCDLESYDILISIGEKCPNLRTLVLEMAWRRPKKLKRKLAKMLKGFLRLEDLSIKIRGSDHPYYLDILDLPLPETITDLKLQPVREQDTYRFISKIRDETNIPTDSMKTEMWSNLAFNISTLQRLSLVLDVISDRLVTLITTSLPFLVELELEDRPFSPPEEIDLTNNGLQSIGSCKLLTSLSIVRSKVHWAVSFKRINDLGLFVLSESCRGLESIKLDGFSVVTDAGFASLFRSCHNLKTFEIRNAALLSDLAFHDIFGVVCPLVELRLRHCRLITSEAITEVGSCSTLELLDTNGCRSIADRSINYISHLKSLKSLNLGGADITDKGLGILSGGDLPLVTLSLRGCIRVTHKGIIYMFSDGKRINKTLTSLDVGYMQGMSDEAIYAIVAKAEAITELCMRHCFHVTDSSIEALASTRNNEWNQIRRLDICNCKTLSIGIMELFRKPLFRGLRWIGVGRTSVFHKKAEFNVICETRSSLTVCYDDCEVGCHDGWQHHT